MRTSVFVSRPAVVAMQRHVRAPIIWLACIVSPLVAGTARAGVDVTMTADNAYIIGWGDGDSMDVSYGPFINNTANDIASCVTGVERVTLSGIGRDDYVYVAAWSDDSSWQGLLGQFRTSGSPVYTGAGNWSVCATGVDFDTTAPAIDGPAGSSAINAQIAVCNAGTGSPETTSAGWVGLNGGNTGNLEYGEPNTDGGSYGAIPCIDADARWMWFNADPSTYAYSITSGPPGTGHKEYLLFRLSGASLPYCGNGIVDDGEQCDDGNVNGGDCCSPSCAAECDDANACTTDACDNRTGVCAHEPLVCADDDACTSDSCNPASGCVFATTAPCTDSGYETCHLAVLRAASKAAAVEIKARGNCEEDKIAGALPSELDCTFDLETQAAVDKATAKLASVASERCAFPSQTGWPALCPDFVGAGCGSLAIADGDGLSQCLSCLQHVMVAQALDAAYGAWAESSPLAEAAKCRKTIGRTAAKYFATRIKATAACQAGRITGAHSNECPFPGDGKSAQSIQKAEAKLVSKIAKACGTFTASQVGFEGFCPDAGGCGGSISGIASVLDCVGCVGEFSAECLSSAYMMPREAVGSPCASPVNPCSDGLDCTVDELVEYVEEPEIDQVCFGGTNDGLSCETNADCPSATCGPLPQSGSSCTGGSSEGEPCTSNADCPAGACVEAGPACCPAGVCIAGNIGVECMGDADCGCIVPEPEVEQECTHTPQVGEQYGYWLWLCSGGTRDGKFCATNADCPGPGDPHECVNVSPCCEDDSDCAMPEPEEGYTGPQPDPCMIGSCATETHRCVFEKMDPSDCTDENTPPFIPPSSTPPCVEPAPLGQLCELTAIEDSVPTVTLYVEKKEPTPHYADVHVHMFAEESWVARAPNAKFHWVNDTVTGTSGSCDGGVTHGRVRTIMPILETFDECLVEYPEDFALLQYLKDGACGALNPTCAPLRSLLESKGPRLMSEFMSKTEGTRGDTGKHDDRRHPWTGWPRWDTVAHHKVKEDRLKVAKDRGLRLIVVMATGTRGLCELLPDEESSIGDSCNEMDAVDRQLAEAQEFDDDHAWAQIVTTPQQAIDAINTDKLAMVLSIETTELFRNIESTINYGTEAEIRAAVRAQIKKYKRLGVSAMHIAHLTDSLFAGAAESNFAGSLLQFMYDPDPEVEKCYHENFWPVVTKLGFNFKKEWDDYAGRELYKNERGLREPAGRILIEELMSAEMLIDLSHCSEETIQDVWEMAYAGLPPAQGRDNAGPYYPFHFSHARFREIVTPKAATEYILPSWIVQRVRRVGGIVGLRTNGDEMRTYARPPVVENTCSGSSRSFAQMLRFGSEGMKVPITLGTDLMTLGHYPRPRFRDNTLPGKPRTNRNGACAAGFRAEGICQAREQEAAGGGTGSIFDTHGLASVGEEQDLLVDLEKVGVPLPTLNKLKESAADYIRMWIRATTERHGPAALANVGTGPSDMDLGGIAEYVPLNKRKNDESRYDWHSTCHQWYCPNTQSLGEECLFDGECQEHQVCGGWNLCGLNFGKCVCTIDGGCTDDEAQWCKLGLPGRFDNKCKQKKGDGGWCRADRQCVSGKCKWGFCDGPH